ncbi:MAG: sugar phosphate isomerase/epimerase [Fimbriimonadaceae bacterium]|nr:sugar phosphate isomerase/epimerase [Fimbriimonadaceae bacterium]
MGAPRFPLSAFADEIDRSVDVQLACLRANGVEMLDVRGAEGYNVMDFSPALLAKVKRRAAEEGIGIHGVGSPVNKIRLEPKAARMEVAKFAKACDIANRFGTRKVRVFTPEAEGGLNEGAWPEVRAQLRDMIAIADEKGIVILHENDAKFYGAYPSQARRIFEELGSPAFRAVFDFANTVLLGYRAFDDWFPWILPHLDSLHIKDAIFEGQRIVPSGEGEGQMVETFRFLIESGWVGTLSLEPHLSAAGPFSGFTGPELFGSAVRALRNAVEKAGGTC